MAHPFCAQALSLPVHPTSTLWPVAYKINVMFYNRKDQSLQLMQSSETESGAEEEEVGEMFSEMVTHEDPFVTKEGTRKIQKEIAKNTGVFTADKKEAILQNSSQLGNAKVSRQWCSLFIYHSYSTVQK